MAERLLAEIMGVIREQCAIRNIPIETTRFFGSRIRAEAKEDADVDMLIVSPAFEGKDIFERAEMTKGLHRLLVKRFNLPFDIVFYSVDEWLNGNSLFLQEIRQVA
jgi:predicted nucleotidyltransferase